MGFPLPPTHGGNILPGTCSGTAVQLSISSCTAPAQSLLPAREGGTCPCTEQIPSTPQAREPLLQNVCLWLITASPVTAGDQWPSLWPWQPPAHQCVVAKPPAVVGPQPLGTLILKMQRSGSHSWPSPPGSSEEGTGLVAPISKVKAGEKNEY